MLVLQIAVERWPSKYPPRVPRAWVSHAGRWYYLTTTYSGTPLLRLARFFVFGCWSKCEPHPECTSVLETTRGYCNAKSQELEDRWKRLLWNPKAVFSQPIRRVTCRFSCNPRVGYSSLTCENCV